MFRTFDCLLQFPECACPGLKSATMTHDLIAKHDEEEKLLLKFSLCAKNAKLLVFLPAFLWSWVKEKGEERNNNELKTQVSGNGQRLQCLTITRIVMFQSFNKLLWFLFHHPDYIFLPSFFFSSFPKESIKRGSYLARTKKKLREIFSVERLHCNLIKTTITSVVVSCILRGIFLLALWEIVETLHWVLMEIA